MSVRQTGSKVLIANYLKKLDQWDLSQHKTKVHAIYERMMMTSWSEVSGAHLHQLSTHLKGSLLPRLQKSNLNADLVSKIESLQNRLFFDMTSVQAIQVARSLIGNNLLQFLNERSAVVRLWVIKELHLSEDDQWMLAPHLNALLTATPQPDMRCPLEEQKPVTSLEKLVREAIAPHPILSDQIRFEEMVEQNVDRFIDDDPEEQLFPMALFPTSEPRETALPISELREEMDASFNAYDSEEEENSELQIALQASMEIANIKPRDPLERFLESYNLDNFLLLPLEQRDQALRSLIDPTCIHITLFMYRMVQDSRFFDRMNGEIPAKALYDVVKGDPLLLKVFFKGFSSDRDLLPIFYKTLIKDSSFFISHDGVVPSDQLLSAIGSNGDLLVPYLDALCRIRLHITPHGFVGIGHLMASLEKVTSHTQVREKIFERIVLRTISDYAQLFIDGIRKGDVKEIEAAFVQNIVCYEKMVELFNLLTDEKHRQTLTEKKMALTISLRGSIERYATDPETRARFVAMASIIQKPTFDQIDLYLSCLRKKGTSEDVLKGLEEALWKLSVN